MRGDDRLYVTIKNSGFDFVKGLYENKVVPTEEVDIVIDGMRGTVLLSDDCIIEGG